MDMDIEAVGLLRFTKLRALFVARQLLVLPDRLMLSCGNAATDLAQFVPLALLVALEDCSFFCATSLADMYSRNGS